MLSTRWVRAISALCGGLFVLASPLLAQEVLVLPYVQPAGDGKLTDTDAAALYWWTNAVPADFQVEFGPADGDERRHTTPARIALDFAKAPESKAASKQPTEREQHYLRYVAELSDLPPSTPIRYRVTRGDTLIREATFRTRAKANEAIRFALVGDMSNGKDPQKAIAFRIAGEQPQFLIALGDIVYPTGRVSQYMAHYWKTYNDVETPSLATGAPLMATVPFYAILGNHDVAAKYPAIPDALGAYYFFQAPQQSAGDGPWATPLGSDETAAQRFRAATPASYPQLDAYSFDVGPAHVLVLNSNRSGNVDEPELRSWVERDLTASKSRWKFVCYHAPAFHSSTEHYAEQAMRLWHPLFEAGGVDLVFNGHVHNYQRSAPLRFAPATGKRDKRGRVDGEFTLDRAFDGEANRRPQGIIHIVAGGGGATLYSKSLEKTAESLKKDHGANYADFTARHVADRHSFVMIDLSPTELSLRAIDQAGDEVDRIAISKPE